MTQTLSWRLRHIMAERGLFQTTDLGVLLREQGISLSREQVFRLVTQPPQRLNIEVLTALCTVLECTPNDLLELTSASAQAPIAKTGTDRSSSAITTDGVVRARVRRPTQAQ